MVLAPAACLAEAVKLAVLVDLQLRGCPLEIQVDNGSPLFFQGQLLLM